MADHSADVAISLPDVLYTGLPASAHEFDAAESEQTIGLSTMGSAVGKFTVDLGRDLEPFGRAFLVYELNGLPHFTAAMRSINGQRPEGGFGVSYGAKGGREVEEIAPAWLHPGSNSIQFLPADKHSPTSYRVSHVRLVTFSPRSDQLADEGVRNWAALLDGKEATGWKLEPGAKTNKRIWPFDGPTQPRMLDFRLSTAGSGTLSVSAGGSGLVTAKLEGLSVGWHRLPLETLQAADGLTLTLAAGGETAPTVSELAISGSPVPLDESPRLQVTYPLSGECVNHRVHVRGFLSPPNDASLSVNGTLVSGALTAQGAFAVDMAEKSLSGSVGKPFKLTLESSYPDGTRVRKVVDIGGCAERPPEVIADNGRPRQPREDLGAPYGVTVTAGSTAVLSFAGTRLEVPAGAVEKDVRVTLRPLAGAEVAPLDSGMTNVTPGGQAFRFGPLGMIFKKPVRMVLPYDRARLPAGFSEGDVRTFYFDEATHRWQQVGLVGQDGEQMVAVSEHFTDFINATIVTPDHPGTQSLNPTSLKDMKLADPAAGVTLIEPPVANSSGMANLRFPIEVPPGRGGLAPGLAITYNSESRNGWLGVGWDLHTSAIQIDTRFGVPKYDGSEIYSLDGEMLTQISPPNDSPPPGGQYFARRVEGRFDWIQRLGTGPTDFTWIVTDKNGTKSYYGETTNSRLADPTATNGNIFRWALTRVRDPFGNEMKVTYESDADTNGEPFTDLYPLTFDYTSNAVSGLQAAYHVDLVRGGPSGSACDRADVIVDGRPGFQKLTRCLLRAVQVRLGTQVIRRYDLDYQPASAASLQKTLLSSISMRGLDGAHVLYRHDFTYFSTPVEQHAGALDLVSVFQPPVSWATPVNANGSPRTADSLVHNQEISASHSTHGGVGVAQGSALDVGASDTVSGETTDWRLLDFNGDSLPDGIGGDNLLNVSDLVAKGTPADPNDRTRVELFAGKFSPSSPGNFGTDVPLSSVKRDVINIQGGSLGTVHLSGDIDLVNTSRDMATMSDIDGDGFVDQLVPSKDGLTVRLNDGHNVLGKAQSWPNYSISNKSCSLQHFLGPIQKIEDTVARNIIRYVPGASGVLNIAGQIDKGRKTVEGEAKSVAVTIYHAITSIFSFQVTPGFTPPQTAPFFQEFRVTLDKNSPPCSPGPGNTCSGGLTIPVQAGDRLYLVMNSDVDSSGDAISWDPQFTYVSVDSVPVSASQLDLQEPDGSFIYRASQSGDFKPSGRSFVKWSADSNGTVAIDGQVVKSVTSDDVSVQILKEPVDGPTQVVLSTQLTAETAKTQSMALSNIAVQAGDKLSFQVLSDLPIDPDRVQWQPSVTYQNYCRNDASGSPVCGDVQCSTVDPVTCTVANDPVPSYPVPPTILRNHVPVFYPLFRYQPGMLTQTIKTTQSGPANITGTFMKAGVTAAPVVVAIQGVNRLFLKKIFQPNEMGSFSMAATTPALQAGDQLFFTVYSDTDVSGVVTWAPQLEGVPCPVNLRRRADGTTRDPSGIGVVEMMGGGFHGWSYGDVIGPEPQAEADLTFDPNATEHAVFPLLAVPALQTDSSSGPPVIQFVDLNPIDFGTSIYHLGGRVVGGVEDAGNGVGAVFRSGASKGIHFLGSVFNTVESLACEIDHPVRITKTANKGFSGGIDQISLGLNTGSSHTTVEFMDMNGDRYPDSVQADGIRFNTGTQFAASPSTGLPLGDPRVSEHRDIHLGGSDNDLVSITNGSGESRGYVGAGLSLSYGVSATGVDLVDINGDGLPDHVQSDPSTGGITVRLNFGTHFGAAITWSSKQWLNQTLTTQTDWVNKFGDDLRTDSLRVEDTSTNNASISGGGNKGNFGFGASTSASDTMIRQLVDLIDINGDGLPDQVMRSPGMECIGGSQAPGAGCLRAKLNLGDRFDDERQIPIAPWPAGASPGTPEGLRKFGLGAPDALSFSVGAGNAGGFTINWQVWIFEFGGGDSWSANDLQTSLAFDDIDGDGTVDQVLKADGNANVYARLNQTGKTNLLKHVDRPLGGSFDLDYSREGNKVDGTQLIDMPKNQWVLSKVHVDDGQGNHNQFVFDYTLAGPGAPANTRIGSGHYARDEREDYGYGHVTTIRGVRQADGSVEGGDGSRLERFFFNHDFYQKGLLRAEFELNPGGGLMNGTLMTYADPGKSVPSRTGRFFPSQLQRVTAFYEGSGTTVGAALGDPSGFGLAPKYLLEKRPLYDNDGNLLTLEDWGDEQNSDDDLAYSITYIREPGTHITRASQIDATPRTASGTLLRRRTATFDSGLGSIRTLTNVVTGGKSPATGVLYDGAASTYTYTHDGFGNLATITDPVGYQLKYTYDTTSQTHMTRVDDLSFGYFSTSVPDLRFAAPKSATDVNGQIESFTYDEFGRPETVTGPADQASTPTIKMVYGQQSPTSAVPIWAATQHKDIQAPADPIETVTFIDGLGRVIQTKKDTVLDAAGDGSVLTGMMVSGQVIFDGRGRISQQGQPGFSQEAAHDFVATPRVDENFTLFTYDSLNRLTKQILPDGATTTTRHFVGPVGSDGLGDGKKWLMTEMIDALGNGVTSPPHDTNVGRRLAYSDSRGNRVAVREFNTVGTNPVLTALTTNYSYDRLNQLQLVIDAKGNTTTAGYDSTGKMVTLTSPDAGTTEYRYDLAGNLGAKQTPNLRAKGPNVAISYAYDFDRLKSITYPSIPKVTYTYGAPTEAGNAAGNVAGRIKKVTFDGGSETRTYDRMGNVSQAKTTLPNMSSTGPASLSFTMKYTYDWLGRMQTMTFPELLDTNFANRPGTSEVVTYNYDRGGNIDSITGKYPNANPPKRNTPGKYTYLLHVGYNEFEQRTVWKSGNGIENRYGYDALTRRLTDIKADSFGTQERQLGKPPTPFHRLHYTYDSVGNILEMTNNVSVQPFMNGPVFVGPLDVQYTYDNLYQLRTLSGKYRFNQPCGFQYSDAYTYDEIGNILTKSQSQDRIAWDNQNVNTKDPNPVATQLPGSEFVHNVTGLTYSLDYRYTTTRPHATTPIIETLPGQSSSPRTYSYDADGNNTGNSFQYDTRTQIWDDEDRLKEVDLNGGFLAKFKYNDQGERTKKHTANGDSWYVNQFFLLMPTNVIAKHIFAGETRVTTKTDTLDEGAPTLDWYHSDHLGSTSYTSNQSQDLVQHERYFAFGELWRPGGEVDEISWNGNIQRNWLYTAKEWDPNESLYYFGARYFDPHADVWQSPDPILASYVGKGAAGASPANLGLYTYAWNNPVVVRDPDGRAATSFDATAANEAIKRAPEVTAAAVRAGIQEGITKWGYDPQRAAIYGALKGTGQGTTARDVEAVLLTGVTRVEGINMSQSSAALADVELHIAGAVLMALAGEAAVAGGGGGASSATKGGLSEAEAARDALSAELAPLKGRAPATVTGGYNVETGEVAARACGGGKCAEDHVVDALGGNKAHVGFTRAVRPRTGAEVPVCARCEATYGRGAFPPGTKFKSD